ncbi:hypothetical protein [Actinoplanes sp. NPDC026623]|uniref:hypothetical protein n=1 Tax=Actinoplanes sp. NPDC026623 TaxID=3155610 RepID=UPI00340E0047
MSRSQWLSRVGLALLTTVSAGALTAPAEAATTGVASVVETVKVQYQAASGKQNKVVATRSGNTITIDDVVAIKAGKGCKAVKGDKTSIYQPNAVSEGAVDLRQDLLDAGSNGTTGDTCYPSPTDIVSACETVITR